ncbi:MAG: trimethylamine methyltransferase family protein [Chloroflexi bacterium]|nr:trimethylamine methyltransferase family protein [Chloroflexota bacterium]
MRANLSLKLLSSQEVAIIYEKAVQVLATIGITVEHAQALDVLEKAGAQVNHASQKVTFSRELTEAALRTCPRTLRLGGSHDLYFPHPEGSFHTRGGTGAPCYIEAETLLCRSSTLADVAEFGQLADRLDRISSVTFPTAGDMPQATADLHAFKALLEGTAKHITIQPFSAASVTYLLEMAAVASDSPGKLRERPIVSIITAARSPLQFEPWATEVILRAPRYGVPIHACTLGSAGATAPITTAGAVLQGAAEILAGMVMTQLVQPGTPLIAGPSFYTLDMKTGATVDSSVEAALGLAALTQLIKETLHVPVRSMGLGSDSLVPDGQALMQKSTKGLLVALSGCDILDGAGRVDSAKALSPVQLIMDDLLIGILQRTLSGLTVDAETLAWNEIMQGASAGHYLASAHTLRHCREAFQSELILNQPRDTWAAAGSKDLYHRALDKYYEFKRDPKPGILPDVAVRELQRIVEKADTSLVS